jgi:hypothetical protein
VTTRKRRAERAWSFARSSRESGLRGHGLGTCPACGKRAYATKASSKAAAAHLFPGVVMRQYECADRPGFWHITSQTAGVAEVQRAVEAAVRGDAQAAAAYTAQVVAGTGRGPTWNELADAVGWPAGKEIRRVIICILATQGWLRTGQEPRSLRPGPLFSP